MQFLIFLTEMYFWRAIKTLPRKASLRSLHKKSFSRVYSLRHTKKWTSHSVSALGKIMTEKVAAPGRECRRGSRSIQEQKMQRNFFPTQ